MLRKHFVQEAAHFTVCENHRYLTLDEREAARTKKTICAGCLTSKNTTQLREANLKNSVSVTIASEVIVTLGQPICNTCRVIGLNEEDGQQLTSYLKREHEVAMQHQQPAGGGDRMDIVWQQEGEEGGSDDMGEGGLPPSLSATSMSTDDDGSAIPDSQGSFGTEWRASFQYQKGQRVLEIAKEGASSKVKIPARPFLDDRSEGKMTIRHHRNKIQNLIECLTEMMFPYTDRWIGLNIMHKCLTHLKDNIRPEAEDVPTPLLSGVFR